MPNYSYVATDINGGTVKGKEFAEDYVELTEKLREKNLFGSFATCAASFFISLRPLKIFL